MSDPWERLTAASAVIVNKKGATRWDGVYDPDTGNFAYKAPTGTGRWVSTIVRPGQYTALRIKEHQP